MSGVILAVLDDPGVASRTLAAAQCFAGLAGAGLINALAIRTPPFATIMATEEILTEAQERHIREGEAQRVETLRKAFEAWRASASEAGLAAKWNDVEGSAEVLVRDWGMRSDFLVLARPHLHDYQERQAIHAALFDTGRPVLAIPADPFPPVFGRRVAVAWRDDLRTIQAVLAALRCLTRAQRVLVLAGVRDHAPRPSLPDIFTEHAVPAELHVLPITGGGAFGEALLAKARELGADMLVLGAYVHSQLRGLILGGVTRYVLSHAAIPVLMRH